MNAPNISGQCNMFTAVDTNLRHLLQASMADLDLSANHFSRNYEIG